MISEERLLEIERSSLYDIDSVLWLHIKELIDEVRRLRGDGAALERLLELVTKERDEALARVKELEADKAKEKL